MFWEEGKAGDGGVPGWCVRTSLSPFSCVHDLPFLYALPRMQAAEMPQEKLSHG